MKATQMNAATVLKRLLVMVGLCLSAAMVQAQNPNLDNPFNGNPGGNNNTTAVPFDGGLSLLVAGGVAYHLRKRIQQKTKDHK